MHTFIQKSRPVVFMHFRVSVAACVTNFYLEHLFYIDNSKNIIFDILLPISCKKMKHPSFLIHFGKRIDDKWWVGVRLGRPDR